MLKKIQSNIKRQSSSIFGVLAVLAMLATSFVPFAANAGTLTNRKVTLGSSTPSASTTYAFNFTPAGTTVGSFAAQICTTPSGTCTAAPGFANSSSVTVTNITGTWTGSTATAGTLKAAAGTAGTATNPVTIQFNNVTNPNVTNTTYYARMTTYSTTTYTTVVDTGVVAFSTAPVTTVTASVDETLTFCVYDTGASCASPGTGTVALGTLTTSAAATGSNQMEATTNSTSGYVITYVSPNSLKSGANTITQNGASATASSPGSQQFGLYLSASGGSGTVTSPYATASSYAFQGDAATHQVASATAATNKTTYTANYLANIDGLVAPGSYSTTLTYVCTPQY